MIEKILEYERELFLLLNSFHSPFFDQFMWFYSGLAYWIPLLVSFIIILFYANRQRWKEMLLIIAAIIVVILLCDRFSSGFCKPFFSRLRPTHHPNFMNDVMTVFGYRGSSYGFISSHAANGFGFATITSLIFRNKYFSVSIFLWATVSAYSRIYLGVHFISDIIPGIASGLFFAWITFRLFKFAHKKIFLKRKQYDDFPSKGLVIILFLLILTIALMVIISLLLAYREACF